MAEEVPSRRKVYSNIKPEIAEQFERICYDNYAQNAMNKRKIKLSINNPFEESNKSPAEYLVPDKILEKPGQISDLSQFKTTKPLAGRFSEVGEKIFEMGHKKAYLIQTGPWHEI